MTKVNWDKIKKYEKKPVFIIVCLVFLALFICSFIIAANSSLRLKPLRFLTGLFITLILALDVKIESRMLQLYMLLGTLGVSFILASFLPFPAWLAILLFVLTLLGVVASLALSVATGVLVNQDTRYQFPETDRGALYSGKNVMFFAPHEDDEINIYSGILPEFVKNNSTVRIVFYTNGDYYNLASVRAREAVKAAAVYKIPEENIIFLGYSDSIETRHGIHIYNTNSDVEIRSRTRHTSVYSTRRKPPFNPESKYIRRDILRDFEDVIKKYKPDTIFCCDYDRHADHRAASLFFEEALGNIMARDKSYRPAVYKGFAYSTAWNGKQDYYSLNAKSTELREPSKYMTENNIYLWADRVRFPVAKESLSRVMQNSIDYEAMMQYSSQTATDHACGILNGDKVFWARNTKSVLYGANVAASSGDASNINTFKLVDSADISHEDGVPSAGVWTADLTDERKIVAIKLPSPTRISSIVIYESPAANSHIKNAKLYIGASVHDTGELKPNGGPTVFEFSPTLVDTIALRVTDYIGTCSVAKIEAYEQTGDDNPLVFIKAQNTNNDFVYDYAISKTGKEDFSVYTYPLQEDFKFDVTSDSKNVRCIQTESGFTVYCPEGEHGNITVRSIKNPAICDTFFVSNPSEKARDLVASKQRLEKRFMSPPCQGDYYRGLVRRLGVYK